MDWKLAMEAERAALMRIVALLFALADLAESAGSRSGAVRGFVLWILRRAEIVARDLVSGAAAPDDFVRTGNSSENAIRLAENFRQLARELADEVDRQIALAFAVYEDPGQNEQARFAGGVLNIMSALAFAAWGALRRARFPDTS